MKYIFIGMLLGSTVNSSHDTREACEGRKVVLSEKGVIGQCVSAVDNQFSASGSYLNGTIQLTPSR